jgi:hypothetical protein
MSVELEIVDGSPHWWASPNIWVVPGDPSGAPGMPVVGEDCFLYARVTNNGTTAVQNATVRFYWANPSVGFDRTTANHIGDANVSLDAGETQDVLCLIPWVPIFVNGGHECVLAEAFHSTDDPLPMTPAFNVPTDRHVAQRNLSVVMMMKAQKMFHLSFEVCNTGREARTFQINTIPGRIEELKELLPTLGRSFPKLGKGEIKNVGFVAKPCPDEDDHKHAKPVVERFEVRPETCLGLSVMGELEGEAALLHVVQTADGKEVGGLSVLVVRGTETAKTANREAK